MKKNWKHIIVYGSALLMMLPARISDFFNFIMVVLNLSEKNNILIKATKNIGKSMINISLNKPIFLYFSIATIIILFFVLVLLIIWHKSRQAYMEAKVLKSQLEAKTRFEFLSRMSHEIRTPMNAIIGLSDTIIMMDNVPQELIDNIVKIQSSSKYLLGLINNILDMSKLDQEKVVLAREPFSLNKLISSISSMLQGEAKRFNVEFRVNKRIKHDIIYGDEIRLRQVITNLLSNAFKYTASNGFVELTISETSSADGKAQYKFIVQDTGVGIPKSEQQRIFEAFEQVDSQLTHTQGTGLGLPISQGFVKLMGGEIKVESEKGQGSTFIFDLTFDLAPDDYFEQKRQVSNYDHIKDKNILVVEDNIINTEIIVAFLENKNAKVYNASNGSEALEMFKISKPNFYDLILMDIQMPVMDGITSTKLIRSLDRKDSKDIPIVALTANTFKEDMNLSYEAGMVDFIPKPIDINVFYEKIDLLLKETSHESL